MGLLVHSRRCLRLFVAGEAVIETRPDLAAAFSSSATDQAFSSSYRLSGSVAAVAANRMAIRRYWVAFPRSLSAGNIVMDQ